MKQLYILFLSFVAIVNSTQAQTVAPKFELKATGFVGPDSTKNYLVIEVPKMSKADMYKKTLTFLNGYYKNPTAVLSTVDGESIIVNAITNDIKGHVDTWQYPLAYNIKLDFKDNLIKMQPSIVELSEVKSDGDKLKYYLRDLDSPNKGETNTIFIVSRKTGKGIVFKKDLKASIEDWLNGYVTGLTRYLDEKW